MYTEGKTEHIFGTIKSNGVIFVSWYIAIVVSDDIMFEQLNDIAFKNNIKLSPLHNNHAIGQLPERLTCFLTEWIENKYHTALENNNGNNLDIQGTLEMLDGCGHTNNQVSNEFVEKLKNDVTQIQATRIKDAQNWMCFIREFIEKNNGRKIGLIMHFYETTFEEEELNMTHIEEINIAQLDEESMLDIQGDILYYFLPSASIPLS